ncbi:MAG TPA: TonB-dependent receptor plug domain-containing protein [Polyangiaceae bacterium]|nr:TonB-dependent receptor plug domain-containing protein [Polyangiaceae bacterium]
MNWPKSRAGLAISASLAIPVTAAAEPSDRPPASSSSTPAAEPLGQGQTPKPQSTGESSRAARAEKDEEEVTAEDLEGLSLEALLDVKVVTASKEAVRAKDSAAIVTVFTRKQIEELNATQLIDLLAHVPGFYEVSAQYGRNVSVRGIHGATAQHIVVLKDGVSISDFLTATAPLEVPLDDVERVEVVRGPGSALYGGNALMSVINLITRSVDLNGGNRVKLSIGTDNYYRAALASNLGFKDADGRSRGLFLTASVWSFGGTRARASGNESILFPARGVNNSDGLANGETYTLPGASTGIRVDRQNLSAHVGARYDASESLVLRGSFDHVADGMQRNYIQMLIRSGDRNVNDTYETQRAHLDLEKSWGAGNQSGRLVLHPFFTVVRQTLESQRLPKSVYTDAARENQSVSFGFSGNDLRAGSVIDYHLDLPQFSFFQENSLLIGSQLEYDVAHNYSLKRCFVDAANAQLPSRYNTPGGADLYCIETVMLNEGTTLSPTAFSDSNTSHLGDGDEFLLAGYGQISSRLSTGLRLVVGGRVDYRDGTSGNSGSPVRFSPRVAAVQPLPGDFYLKAQYANAFIRPAFLYRTSNDLSDYEGNPNIREQSIMNVEALVGYGGSRYIQPEISGYYYKVHDFITFDLVKNARTGHYRFDNQGEIDVIGAEASIGLGSPGGFVSARINAAAAEPLSGTSPRFEVDGQLGGPTKYPSFLGGMALRIQPIDSLTVIATFNYNSKVKHRIPPEAQFSRVIGADGVTYSSRPADDFATGNVAIVGANVVWNWNAIQISVHGQNLFDNVYYRPGSVLVPYYAEGRRLMASVSYNY